MRTNMLFAVDYDNTNPTGYVVTYKCLKPNGYVGYMPLRKFAEQGDAYIFREDDCPHLSESSIKLLIKNYNRNKRYKRISAKRFVDYDKWVEQLYQQELALL